MISERAVPERRFDLCVIGAGPVGLATALEAGKRGLSVLVLESGGTVPEPSGSPLSTAFIRQPKHHAPMEMVTGRALGGTSWFWGGGCLPFDPIDFEPREGVAGSGWPIDLKHVEPYFRDAADYLDCGSANFAAAADSLAIIGQDATFDEMMRWSRRRTAGSYHKAELATSERVDVRLRHTVVGLTVDGPRVKSLAVHAAGSRVTIPIERAVIACGGVETTRLLLAARSERPELFGGRDGPLGRYYMGHLYGNVADIVLENPKDVAHIEARPDATGAYVRRRFKIRPETLRRERLRNIGFYAENPLCRNVDHRSGALSLVFMTLAIAPIGRFFVSEGMRRAHVGLPPHRFAAHLLNVVKAPIDTIIQLGNILGARYLNKTNGPVFLIRNRGGRYSICYHSEQAPRRDNRITLADQRDPLGLPRIVINFGYDEEDIRSIVRAHEILDESLRLSGLGRLEYRHPRDRLAAEIFDQATDGYHQAGTTRMGTDPRSSVVDANCKVHDLDNLYVASSSVFPTSGQANPTFLATALGVRLAHHLSKQAL